MHYKRGRENMSSNLMKGVIDMHVHSNPDLRLRAYDDFELMEAGIRAGARGIVIKTHQGSTAERAYLCNRYNERVHGGTNDFTMFGSITRKRRRLRLNWERRLYGCPRSQPETTWKRWGRMPASARKW